MLVTRTWEEREVALRRELILLLAPVPRATRLRVWEIVNEVASNVVDMAVIVGVIQRVERASQDAAWRGQGNGDLRQALEELRALRSVTVAEDEHAARPTEGANG